MCGRFLLWSGRGSRIWPWWGPGWGWCRTRRWPPSRWSERWPYSVQWPAPSMPSSPESPLTPVGGRRLRCSRPSREAAPRPLTPLWRGSPAQRGHAPTPSSPACRSVTDSSFWSCLLQEGKTTNMFTTLRMHLTTALFAVQGLYIFLFSA